MTAYDDAVLALSPYLFWKCDETSGTTLADASGNNRPGTLNNGGTLGLDGPFSGASAIGLDGVDDYIERTSISLTGKPRSVVLWVRFDTLSSSMRLASVGKSGDLGVNNQFSGQFTTSSPVGVRALSEDSSGGNLTIGDTVSASTETWYMVTLRRGSDGTQPAELIVNNFDGTSTAGDNTQGTTSLILNVGSLATADGQFLDGRVSRIALLDARITDQEIADLYNAASEAGFQAAWAQHVNSYIGLST